MVGRKGVTPCGIAVAYDGFLGCSRVAAMRHSPTVALVPLRAPGSGKTRLAGGGPNLGLSRDERAALTGAMLADVAAALVASRVDRVVVAAGGTEAAVAAAGLGLDVLGDPPGASSLNAAIRSATARLRDAGALLVVAADLPGLTAEEVDLVLEEPTDVVVAPTRRGGTGGLLRRPPHAIRPAYGAGSAARHLGLAVTGGRSVASVHLSGFHEDVDTWDDLRRAAARRVGPATAAFLATITDRLTAAG